MVGSTLGFYRLLNKLGAGGMGEVYRAHDERLQRDVAIKVLPPATFQDETARTRLLREARAAAALNHPAICTIYEVGEAGGHVFIAMELVDGRPLRDSTRGSGLPVTDVLRIGMQIADALAHAHARHIVHRDLKSANVVITADGRAKVLDFGLARRVAGHDGPDADVETRATLTQPGTVVGTLAYMSPEQLRGEVADHRADIWALGVVLYELATGRLPFSAPSGFELSSRILSEPPAPVPAAVPVALRAVIEKCLEKSRDRRYQSANEVRAALEAIQTGVTPAISTLRYQLSHRPWLAAAAIVTVVAVAGLLSIDRLRERWSGDGFRVESLAVLPLENLSGDATQEYFADGLTEVLSTDLARLGALKHVTARGSVMRYKGTTKAPADIARELNVDALVTGSMLRAGDRISITVQLLDPATGNQVWTNRYEDNLRDVLTVRDEIVSAIVREIHAQLSPAERARLAAARPINPEALEAYLKGRFHWLKQTREDYDLAERYYQLAADKDPTYALAYAGLASVWMMRSDTGLLPSSETYPKASALMDKAFALDDNRPALHVALGNHL